MTEAGRGKVSPYFTKKGKFVPSTLGNEIRKEKTFVTFRDTEEIYHYNGEIYQPGGGAVIKEMAKTLLEENFATHYVTETTNYIAYSTFRDREEFNTSPEVVAVNNGLLNVRTKALIDHTPEELITNKIPVTFDPNADCPEFYKFMEDVMEPNDLLTAQEYVGYSLYRGYPFHKAVMLVGDGSNGKSTFLNIITHFFGGENISTPSLHNLLSNRFAMASLYGKMLNIHADLPKQALKYTGAFKMLTGSDTVYAEKKHMDAFSFINYAKMIFSANEIPQTDDKTSAFYRRWIIINFPWAFVDEPDNGNKKRDPHILDKILTEEEMSGVLNWALAGVDRLFFKKTFSYAKTLDEVAEMYEKLSDPMNAFVEDCIDIAPDATESKDLVYNTYAYYMRKKGVPIKDKNVLGRDLPKKLNVETVKTTIKNQRVNCWKGIRVKDGMRAEVKLSTRLESFGTANGETGVVG